MAYNKIIYGGVTLIDLTEDTVTAANLLSGARAHGADGNVVNGGMVDRGAVSGTIATKEGAYSVPAGYHNGEGSVGISGVEKAKIIPGNIKAGVELLGVTGTYAGEGSPTETRTITPTTSTQVVTPTAGYLFSSVTVSAIPYVETDNPQGGKTVTIG